VDAVAGICHAVAADELTERFGPVNPRAAVKVRDVVDEYAAKFIALAPFMVVATASADGACDASPKGGRPGFVQVADPKTLIIPDYKGNALFFGVRNILENPRVGLLFMIPGVEWTLRVGGRARIVDDPETLARFDQTSPAGRGLQLAIEVTVEECYFHCPKAFVSSKLWEGLLRRPVELPPLYGG
jgi:uncharacterized protein